MGVEYVIYSPLTTKKVAKVLARCEERIAEWFEIRADYDDPYGEFDLVGDLPAEEEARAMIRPDGDDGAILARLPTLKVAITIDRPGDFATSPMQVSIMRFLVENAGEGLVQMVDSLVTSEAVLEELAGYQGVEQAARAAADSPAAAPAQPPPPGASGAVLMRFVATQLKGSIDEGVFELHPLANPKALAEDILDYLYARDKRPNAAEFMEWLIDRGDIEEVYGDDDEIYGRFVAS